MRYDDALVLPPIGSAVVLNEFCPCININLCRVFYRSSLLCGYFGEPQKLVRGLPQAVQ